MSRLVIHIGMHNTGSSSIQETLFSKGRHGQFAYADLGAPNQGGMLRSFFSADPHVWGGHRAAGRSHPEVVAFNQGVGELLQSVKGRGGQQVISGEDIYHFDEAAMQRLWTSFSDAFETVDVIIYIRPPASFMASAFVQLVKNHDQSRLGLDKLWPRYRAKLEKFDRIFGRDHVMLRPFGSDSLVDGDVVQDFCHYLGEPIDPDEIRRVNESLSLEATATLFAYRRNGPRYQSYKGKAADNNRLVAMLADFGERKVRFADSLVAPIMERNRDDLDWIESRLGEPLRDSVSAAEGAITSEQDLIDVAADSVEALAAFVERQQAKAEPTPQQIANWVEKLRVAITGRASNGATPGPCSESAFFTPEQVSRLTGEKIGPAVALRELALAFERSGEDVAALNCAEKALELRPDAKDLQRLADRLRKSASPSLPGRKESARPKGQGHNDVNERLAPEFLRSLSAAQRTDTFVRLMQSGELVGKPFKNFMNRRILFFLEWEAAIFQYYEKNPHDVACLSALSFHLGREHKFIRANECLGKWLAIKKMSDNDMARQAMRNQFLAPADECCLPDWELVEPIFQNPLSVASYRLQGFISSARDREESEDSSIEEKTAFQRQLDEAKQDARLTSDIKSRADLSRLVALLRGAKSVAVIGKGNSLKGKGLGADIDGFDVVLRVNHAAKPEQADDFGSRTSAVMYARHLEEKFGKSSAEGAPMGVSVALLDANRSYVARKVQTEQPAEYFLDYLIESITYRRATTGLRVLVLVSLLLDLEADIRAFGFDFYTTLEQPGQSLDSVRNSAAMGHEIDYEYWFARSVLPMISSLRLDHDSD